MPADPTTHDYKATVGLFASGVTILTCQGGDLTHGMTASSFCSVSLHPLLVLVCVQRDAVIRKVMNDAGRFAVSVLATDQEPLARWFSDPARPPGTAQFEPFGWRPGPATGAPLLDGALATLECRTFAVYDGGDHSIIVGQVAGVDGPADPSAQGPLIHHAGRYRRLRPTED